jgi:hypothetical protein
LNEELNEIKKRQKTFSPRIWIFFQLKEVFSSGRRNMSIKIETLKISKIQIEQIKAGKN